MNAEPIRYGDHAVVIHAGRHTHTNGEPERREIGVDAAALAVGRAWTLAHHGDKCKVVRSGRGDVFVRDGKPYLAFVGNKRVELIR